VAERRRTIPLYTLEGVRDAEVTTHWFSTEDGLGLSLLRFRRGDAPPERSVMLVHGLTTSTDMFIMPEHENLVSFLLDNGWTDVWCIDNRQSNRHPYNLHKHRWTLDDVALYDYPPALATMREEVGDAEIHVIAHCLGATSFAMSLFAGLVDVDGLILNSVALTPRVPRWSALKLRVAPGLVEHVLGVPYLNPSWSEDPGFTLPELIARGVSLVHTECDVPACHMLSMMWGSGRPALYEHENLADITHERGRDLYGPTSVHYYRHVRRMVEAGRAVKYDPDEPRHDRLPDDYLADPASVTTPILFVTGRHNRVFTDSNIVCHRRLEQVVPGRHQLHVFDGYGHQDPFMGKDVARDIFPRLLQFLDEQSGSRAGATSATA
jgi:lysosomal acid lipase/cholesteryl ester hydrolase